MAISDFVGDPSKNSQNIHYYVINYLTPKTTVLLKKPINPFNRKKAVAGSGRASHPQWPCGVRVRRCHKLCDALLFMCLSHSYLMLFKHLVIYDSFDCSKNKKSFLIFLFSLPLFSSSFSHSQRDNSFSFPAEWLSLLTMGVSGAHLGRAGLSYCHWKQWCTTVAVV